MTDGRDLEPAAYLDLERWNPWWDDGPLPAGGNPRADLYWRVRNALEHDLLVVPGPPMTGTTQTLHQLVRALALGSGHEHERIADLFRDTESVDAGGCLPEQLCYVDCTDPIAPLETEFVETVQRAYHPIGARTGRLAYYLLFDGIHHIENWREQLLAAREHLAREVPEEWTLVATVPVADLAHGPREFEVDLPHHPQKYRDTLFQADPKLRSQLRPPEESDRHDCIHGVRGRIAAAATGDGTAGDLEEAFAAVVKPIRDRTGDDLTPLTDRYLTEGGFAPALDEPGAASDATVSADAVATHVERGVERTLYRDIPRMATLEESIPRIDHPEELHALVALLARRRFVETTYVDLGEFLSCDTRTIRQKYVPLLEGLHLGERATRYDLERDRTLRFFPRGPGYATAFRGRGVGDHDRTDRLRVTLADHLRRLLARLDGTGGLQYWRDDDHLVDYVLDVGTPVPFVSTFADDLGGSPAALEAFAGAVDRPNLEVVLAGSDADVTVESVDDDRQRLHVPYWAMLAIC